MANMLKLRILIAVGKGKIAQKLYRALTADRYEADTADCMNAAMSLFNSHTYALVFINVNPPNAGGIDLYNYIREEDAETPLIMFTSADTTRLLKTFKPGENDHTVFSDDADRLLFQAVSHIKHPVNNTPTNKRIEAGDIVLNLESKEVMRANKLIFTTTREFLVLEYMARHINKIVLRAEIVSFLKCNNFVPDEISISTCINSLRKKIEWGNSQKRLYTVTGKGYLFV